MRERCTQLGPPHVPHAARQHACLVATPVLQRESDRFGDGDGDTMLAGERMQGGPDREQDGTLLARLRMPLGQQRVLRERLRW